MNPLLPHATLENNQTLKTDFWIREFMTLPHCLAYVGLRYGHLRYTHSFSRLSSSRTSVLYFPRSLPEPTPGSDLQKVSLCLNLSVGTESLPSVHRLRLAA